MANQIHVELFQRGTAAVCEYREAHLREDFDLSGAELPKIALSQTIAWFTDFSKCDLQGADLSKTHFLKARFVGANLENANLSGALLLMADFTGANLKGAVFDDANLAGAMLEAANVEGATFSRAVLNRAVLWKKPLNINLSQVQIRFKGLYSENPFRWSGLDKRVSFSAIDDISDLIRLKRDAWGQSFSMADVIRLKRDAWAQVFSSRLVPLALRFYWELFLNFIPYVSWPLVHKYGTLQLLTKASYLALIVVPFLAFLWPSVERAVEAHDAAVTHASQDANKIGAGIDDLLARHSVGGNAPSEIRQLTELAEHFSAETRLLSARIDEHRIGKPDFPVAIEAIYLAALAVAIGHLFYQMWADDIVKQASRKQFVREASAGFSVNSPDSILRLGAALLQIHRAAETAPDEYHRQLITTSSGVLWIPDNAADFAELPDHCRLAVIESAASTEYDFAAKKMPIAAAVSLLAYVIATVLIIGVVRHQAETVVKAGSIQKIVELVFGHWAAPEAEVP